MGYSVSFVQEEDTNQGIKTKDKRKKIKVTHKISFLGGSR